MSDDLPPDGQITRNISAGSSVHDGTFCPCITVWAWLRLVCAKRNARLHDYYLQLGFIHLQTINLLHRKSGALFKRRIMLSEARRTG
jgi:hypothetical protein